MNPLAPFTLAFVGLKEGQHQFDFKLDQTFFDAFEYSDFNEALFDVEITLLKKATHLEIEIQTIGTVGVHCDLTNEPFRLPIETKFQLLVKFGDSLDDDHEELLILPHGSHQVALAQYIYEMIVLAVPTKLIHPGVEDGSLKSEILDRLKEWDINREHQNDDNTDPRWDSLKKLLK